MELDHQWRMLPLDLVQIHFKQLISWHDYQCKGYKGQKMQVHSIGRPN